MLESNKPIFFDLDPRTHLPTPTTYESMRAALLRRHPVSDGLPDDVQAALLAAVDYVALAFEQANAGRPHLFARLTDDGYVAAVRGLEVALRDRLGRGNSATLERLIEQGIEAGVLPGTERHRDLWDELRWGRNQVAHSRPERPEYGVATSTVVGFIVDAVGEMYAEGKSGVGEP